MPEDHVVPPDPAAPPADDMNASAPAALEAETPPLETAPVSSPADGLPAHVEPATGEVRPAAETSPGDASAAEISPDGSDDAALEASIDAVETADPDDLDDCPYAMPDIGWEAANLAVDQVFPDPEHVRRYFDEEELGELVQTVQRQAVIHPIIVAPADADGRHRIISGERRWRAARALNAERIPCIVRDASEQEILEIRLFENGSGGVRRDLDLMEKALAVRKLCALTGSQAAAAKRLGKSKTWMNLTLAPLNMPDSVLALYFEGFVRDKALLSSVAKILAKDAAAGEALIQIARQGGLTKEVVAAHQPGDRRGKNDSGTPRPTEAPAIVEAATPSAGGGPATVGTAPWDTARPLAAAAPNAAEAPTDAAPAGPAESATGAPGLAPDGGGMPVPPMPQMAAQAPAAAPASGIAPMRDPVPEMRPIDAQYADILLRNVDLEKVRQAMAALALPEETDTESFFLLLLDRCLESNAGASDA